MQRKGPVRTRGAASLSEAGIARQRFSNGPSCIPYLVLEDGSPVPVASGATQCSHGERREPSASMNLKQGSGVGLELERFTAAEILSSRARMTSNPSRPNCPPPFPSSPQRLSLIHLRCSPVFLLFPVFESLPVLTQTVPPTPRSKRNLHNLTLPLNLRRGFAYTLVAC